MFDTLLRLWYECTHQALAGKWFESMWTTCLLCTIVSLVQKSTGGSGTCTVRYGNEHLPKSVFILANKSKLLKTIVGSALIALAQYDHSSTTPVTSLWCLYYLRIERSIGKLSVRYNERF